MHATSAKETMKIETTRKKPAKIGAIRDKAAKVPLGQEIGPFEVALWDIGTDPAMQVRNKLLSDNLSRLRSAYRSETTVKPLLVAFIEEGDEEPRADGEKLIVIDGHHRLRVLETLAADAEKRRETAFQSVQCRVVRLTRAEARHWAAQANNRHGQPLTAKEGRKVFGAMVMAGKHRNEDGSYRRYREISREMGRDHKTIIAWMRADFPKEAKRMEQPEKANVNRDEPPPAPIRLVRHLAEDRVRELLGMFREAASHEDDREAMLSSFEGLLRECRSLALEARAGDCERAFGGPETEGELAPEQPF